MPATTSRSPRRPVPPGLLRINSQGKRLESHKLSTKFKNAITAVRGVITMKAFEYRHRLRSGKGKDLPFERVVECNIGNPQALGSKPLTYVRQVLALLELPGMLDDPILAERFPSDVVARAKMLLSQMPGGIGAYTETQGSRYVRNAVARFIETRDGYPSSVEDIFLTDGASEAMRMILQMCIRTASDVVLAPIPQYPGYRAIAKFCGGDLEGYFLNEAEGWKLDVSEVRRALNDARAEGRSPRALVVINPGNPTGNVLAKEDQEAIVRLCVEERLVLVADEVYQENIWVSDKPFVSFKKVVKDMGISDEALELFSLHSASKGMLGECGKRAGYVECYGIPSEAKQAMQRSLALGLCANAPGQATLELMVNPPKAGDPSFDQYARECAEARTSLPRRAALFCDAFNEMEGVSCCRAEGAFYLFPQITIPAKAAQVARANGVAPDALYAERLLDATGICVVPGSGFGQRQGTHHLRFAFLPQEEDIAAVVDKLKDFHAEFLSEFAEKRGCDQSLL